MQIKAALALIETGQKANYFILAPDLLGLQILLPKSLEKIAARDDIYYLNASSMTKERARQMEREARKAPVGSSDCSWFVIYGLQNLPVESVGPLLKAVEEAKFSAFVFQSQHIPRHCRTLLSRSILMRLPFLQKRVVLGNLQAMHYDARVADEMNLYDGTLSGTIKALLMKDTVVAIRRDLRLGARGLPSTTSEEVVASNAFDAAIGPMLLEHEASFLARDSSPERRKLIAFLTSDREGRK
jgi:hypothetical protein